MISAIITSFKEPKTIGRAIESIGSQISNKDEIIVVAPDRETLDSASKLKNRYSNLRLLQDKGEGKSSALNLAVSHSKGNIIILTDGDVNVDKEAIKQLLIPFKNPKVGAVSGKPVSINPISNKLGFWSYMLTEIADIRRKKAKKVGKRFFCSGYFFAIRRELFPKLPKGLLSEDGLISHQVYAKGYKIDYAENAKVFVKYPSNFKDWINQKKRSAGGYNQIKKLVGADMRSFKSESLGAIDFFKLVNSPIQLIWLFMLFLARIYLWIIIFVDLEVRKKSHKQVWVRVESTK